MKNKIIRVFPNGKKYELTFQGIVEEFGKKVKHSTWMSLESQADGTYDVKEYVCAVPSGEKDIDLTTLSIDCFKDK
ncbi:conserved hypothetical protein [Tenacibaculum maritimum]|nr:conserved hypothetical protein [Tenacibaculum maritimum]